MSSKAKMWLTLLIVAALGVGFLFVASRDSRPDDVLVREALDESIRASKEGRPGGVLDYISDSITFNDIPGVQKRDIARMVRENKPEVTLTNQTVTVNGDSAEIVADVRVVGKIGIGPVSTAFDYPLKGVQMTFRKEDSRKYLIIPSKKWRLTQVKVGEGLPPDLGL